MPYSLVRPSNPYRLIRPFHPSVVWLPCKISNRARCTWQEKTGVASTKLTLLQRGEVRRDTVVPTCSANHSQYKMTQRRGATYAHSKASTSAVSSRRTSLRAPSRGCRPMQKASSRRSAPPIQPPPPLPAAVRPAPKALPPPSSKPICAAARSSSLAVKPELEQMILRNL